MKTDDDQLCPRRIPILSRIAFFPVQFIFGIAHVILSTVAPQWEPTISVGVASGFFGSLPLVILTFLWLIGSALEVVGLCPASLFWKWIAVPFLVLYFVNILVLDQTHTVVRNSGGIPPTNALERAASDFLWAGFTSYFDGYITCVPWSKDAKLPTGGKEAPTYIFGCHPHGIHCMGLIELSNPYNEFAKLFPNVAGLKLTGLAATVIFKIPVVRELFLYMGYVDASRSVVSKALAAGQSLYICIGGEEESLLTTPGKDIYVLQNRKGFVRLALSYGSSLVPVLGIGANQAFTTYKPFLKQRIWLQKNFGVALPFFHGRFFITPLPHKIPIMIVVGEPIPTPKPKIPGEKPSDELVKEYHTRYVEAVRSLHAKHASKTTELIIQ
jgi:hypothetical protein